MSVIIASLFFVFIFCGGMLALNMKSYGKFIPSIKENCDGAVVTVYNNSLVCKIQLITSLLLRQRGAVDGSYSSVVNCANGNMRTREI